MSVRWVEAYIDTRLREGKAANTINWDLIYFRALCLFLIEEGFAVSQSILKLKVLDTPRRLPNPLSLEQVHQVERCIQTAITEAKNDRKQQLAVRDLACFYLLWHCGLRISEVCSLMVKDVDLEGGKLFIRNSKARKDMIVYISDTASVVLQQDYYQGITALDPSSVNLLVSNQDIFRQLIQELKNLGLDQNRHDEILAQMQSLLEDSI